MGVMGASRPPPPVSPPARTSHPCSPPSCPPHSHAGTGFPFETCRINATRGRYTATLSKYYQREGDLGWTFCMRIKVGRPGKQWLAFCALGLRGLRRGRRGRLEVPVDGVVATG